MLKPLAIVATVFLTGCASIMNDTSHPIRLETRTPAGQEVSGADCKLTNDYGSFDAKSGTTFPVRRSSQDLDISCTHAGHQEAKARAISRANVGLVGNIVFGGAVGAVIDHSRGTAYTYPTWIQLIFGEDLVFDRGSEVEGTPLKGTRPKQALQ